MNALEIWYVFVTIHTSQIENQAVYLQTLDSVHHCSALNLLNLRRTKYTTESWTHKPMTFNGRGCKSIEGLIFLICLWSEMAWNALIIFWVDTQVYFGRCNMWTRFYANHMTMYIVLIHDSENDRNKQQENHMLEPSGPSTNWVLSTWACSSDTHVKWNCYPWRGYLR